MASFVITNADSIVISTKRFEKAGAYILEVSFKGISHKMINLQTKGQKLILIAKQGSIQQNPIYGEQFISYSFRFNDDADMERLFRLNLLSKIRISIPKK